MDNNNSQKSDDVDPDDLKWIAAARKGDSDAFGNIVDKYQRAVFNLCYRMLSNTNDAEDAAQEAFLRAYRSLNRYDNNRKFSTWLLSIASHYCIDQIRKRKYLTISLDALPFMELHDGSVGPEMILVNGEKQKKVQELLGSLNEIDRAAVIMRYWYDFSYDEISLALSLTNSAVKSRLHRARQTLAYTWVENEKQTLSTKRLPYGTKTA